MFDLLAQFPIENQDATIRDLHAEALSATRMMAYEMGYTATGEPEYKVQDFEHGLIMECRMAVEPITSAGGRRAK